MFSSSKWQHSDFIDDDGFYDEEDERGDTWRSMNANDRTRAFQQRRWPLGTQWQLRDEVDDFELAPLPAAGYSVHTRSEWPRLQAHDPSFHGNYSEALVYGSTDNLYPNSYGYAYPSNNSAANYHRQINRHGNRDADNYHSRLDPPIKIHSNFYHRRFDQPINSSADLYHRRFDQPSSVTRRSSYRDFSPAAYRSAALRLRSSGHLDRGSSSSSSSSIRGRDSQLHDTSISSWQYAQRLASQRQQQQQQQQQSESSRSRSSSISHTTHSTQTTLLRPSKRSASPGGVSEAPIQQQLVKQDDSSRQLDAVLARLSLKGPTPPPPPVPPPKISTSRSSRRTSVANAAEVDSSRSNFVLKERMREEEEEEEVRKRSCACCFPRHRRYKAASRKRNRRK